MSTAIAQNYNSRPEEAELERNRRKNGTVLFVWQCDGIYKTNTENNARRSPRRSISHIPSRWRAVLDQDRFLHGSCTRAPSTRPAHDTVLLAHSRALAKTQSAPGPTSPNKPGVGGERKLGPGITHLWVPMGTRTQILSPRTQFI